MSQVDDVKARLDIVEVVSGYVALQKSGRYLKALCPFHAEKTPSFIVNPERQSWRCFGACATGGDALSFVMRAGKLEFGEALRLLAQKVGVSLSSPHQSDRDERLYRVNKAAVSFYQDALASPLGRHATEYLDGRGVAEQARATFQLGLSPQDGEGLTRNLVALGFDPAEAVEAGLALQDEGGDTRDFFRGRLMFPIHDRQGRVAGFGGRSLSGSEPKYLNTARTSIFDKRSILYGLHLGAEAIKAWDTAVVVEGYMDAIAAHEHGYTNVVASMGTALTDQQVSQLRSLASRYVLALDPDEAGRSATMRSLESSWRALERRQVGGARRGVVPLYRREPLSLRIAALPPGRDPDQVIRADPREWGRLIEEAVPWLDYLIPAVAARYDLATGQGKADVVEAVFPLIASVGNPFDQGRYVEKLAEVLGVTREALEASVGRPWWSGRAAAGRRGGREPEVQVTASPLSGNREESLEEYTLALLLSRPELREHAAPLKPDLFQQSEGREVFTRWQGCSTVGELESSLDESLRDYLRKLIQKGLVASDRETARADLRQCLKRLEERHLQELQEGLLTTKDIGLPPPRELEETIVSVNSRLKELYAQGSRGTEA